MTDDVLDRSHNVTQFLSWYCVDSVPNPSLVISGIYDVLKRISEYNEYFESFQLNIQLENSYLCKTIELITRICSFELFNICSMLPVSFKLDIQIKVC